MTSAIEYSVIWSALADKSKLSALQAYAAAPADTVEQIVAAARVKRAMAIADAFTSMGSKLAQGLRNFVAAQKRRSAVAQLLAMDDRMLRDIGLTRSEVPLVVCGLATGEAPDVFANAAAFNPASGQANENSRNRAA